VARTAGTPLTRGQVNAVRAAFKAGVTPSRIARQFGLSHSDSLIRRTQAMKATWSNLPVIQPFHFKRLKWKSCGRLQITTLSNSGVQSEQLLFPENSSSRRVTITRVTVEPGAVNPPHRHVASEQIWVALEGNGILLLDHERTEPFSAGDVVRFADGDLHGFRNASNVPFVYLSVTAPPVNFREAYAKEWSRSG
jgi:quercetin dioxygenase-like cupin family protein